MSNKANIEDVFRNNLEGHTIDPSSKVWSGINKKMLGPRMENLYRSSFDGFRINPSEQVWRRVAAIVWFNKFIHFTPFSFNIYYLAIITSTIIGTVVTVNNNQNLNFVPFSNPISQSSKEIIVDEIIIVDSLMEQRNIIKTTTSEDIVIDKSKPNLNTFISSVTKDENNLINKPNNSFINQQNNITVTNPKLIEKTVVVDVEQTVTKDFSQTKAENNNLFFKLEKLSVRNKYTLSYQPTISELADNAFKNIPKLDEIVYDTIGYDYKGEPIVLEKSYFSIEAFYSPYLHSYRSILSNSELNSSFQFYTENIKPLLSYSAGINVAYNYNNFRVETGIGYNCINETLNKEITVFDTITNYFYDHSISNFWEKDTVWILDLDEYLHGNTVYIPVVDSTFVTIADSSLTAYIDSIRIDKNIKAQNSYKFIDIPLIAGYQFTSGKFSITPKAGIITSVLINRNGSYYNIYDDVISESATALNTKILFDYYGSINLQYKLNKYSSIFVEPFVRGDINSMYEREYAINQKSRKFGIKTGIAFRF